MPGCGFPPFGLLQVSETLGLGPLNPEGISPLVMVEGLIADLPSERTDTTAALAAHRASAKWEEEFETLASWFEAGEAVERLLQPLRTRKRRIELPGRRALRRSTPGKGHGAQSRPAAWTTAREPKSELRFMSGVRL